MTLTDADLDQMIADAKWSASGGNKYTIQLTADVLAALEELREWRGCGLSIRVTPPARGEE